MSEHQEWMDQTLGLIRVLEQEKRPAAQNRVVSAQRAVDAVNQQIQALYAAADIYSTVHGLPRLIASVDPEQAVEYQGLGPKEMLAHWAATHGGLVVMRDACNFLADAGMFRDVTQAAGTLYPTITRWDVFEKVARGVYRSIESPGSEVDDAEVEEIEEWDTTPRAIGGDRG